VGFTLRRLAAKVARSKVVERMGELLAPQQLGYGVRKGAEAAVHAARCSTFVISVPVKPS